VSFSYDSDRDDGIDKHVCKLLYPPKSASLSIGVASTLIHQYEMLINNLFACYGQVLPVRLTPLL
jgi:hypothetical protein